MVYGLWFVVCGLWLMYDVAWFMVHGRRLWMGVQFVVGVLDAAYGLRYRVTEYGS